MGGRGRQGARRLGVRFVGSVGSVTKGVVLASDFPDFFLFGDGLPCFFRSRNFFLVLRRNLPRERVADADVAQAASSRGLAPSSAGMDVSPLRTHEPGLVSFRAACFSVAVTPIWQRYCGLPSVPGRTRVICILW